LDKNEYTKKELVAILGVNRNGLSRILRRAGLKATGKGKARRYPRDVVEALQDRLCRGLGLSTINGYLIAAKSFTRWLRDRRMASDPLAHLSRQNAKTDLRRERRALAEPEL